MNIALVRINFEKTIDFEISSNYTNICNQLLLKKSKKKQALLKYLFKKAVIYSIDFDTQYYITYDFFVNCFDKEISGERGNYTNFTKYGMIFLCRITKKKEEFE